MPPGQLLVPTIDVQEAAAARDPASRPGDGSAGPLMVDVRELREFVDVRVPGAVLYPTSSFVHRFEALARDRPLHIICRTGSRSAAVTGFLLRNGWTDVHNVAGGMMAWLHAGLEVRRGALAPGEGDPDA